MNIHAANSDIRQAAFSSGVYLWEIAEAIGVTDGTFSRKLRRELDEKEKKDTAEQTPNGHCKWKRSYHRS